MMSTTTLEQLGDLIEHLKREATVERRTQLRKAITDELGLPDATQDDILKAIRALRANGAEGARQLKEARAERDVALKSLGEVLDACSFSSEELTAKRNEAQAELLEAQVERDEARTECATARAERSRAWEIRAECDEALAERDEVRVERDVALAERDLARAGRADAMTERIHLIGRLEQALVSGARFRKEVADALGLIDPDDAMILLWIAGMRADGTEDNRQLTLARAERDLAQAEHARIQARWERDNEHHLSMMRRVREFLTEDKL